MSTKGSSAVQIVVVLLVVPVLTSIWTWGFSAETQTGCFSPLTSTSAGKEIRDLLEQGLISAAQEALHSYSRDIWEGLLRHCIEPNLREAGAIYIVRWEENLPQIQVSVTEGEPLILDVPVDPVVRFTLWDRLQGVPKVWVAESSTPERARQAWETAVLRLDRPLTILLSCPAEQYLEVRELWRAERASLEQMIEELELPIKVVDLSELPGEEAVREVQRFLSEEGQQVLGFFHRGDTNSFEVGQGGRLGPDEIRAITVEELFENRFLAILGCNPLFFGLNDVFVNSGLAPFTLTVGKTLNAAEIFQNLQRLVGFLREQRETGRTQVPVWKLPQELEELDLSGVGHISLIDVS